jgi:hypothetical protein
MFFRIFSGNTASDRLVSPRLRQKRACPCGGPNRARQRLLIRSSVSSALDLVRMETAARSAG